MPDENESSNEEREEGEESANQYGGGDQNVDAVEQTERVNEDEDEDEEQVGAEQEEEEEEE